MSRTIALTGATGFVGSALTRRLQTAGWQVRALVRPSSSRARLAGIPVQRVEGALEDLPSLCQLVGGADAVVHCAGLVRGASQAHFHRVNVDGVARLAQAAAEQRPPPRFLLISSLAAREPGLSPYAASKHGGELALASAGGAMAWTVLRPPAVYGPGDRELLPLFRWIRRGIAPVLGPDSARFSLLYVEDLAEAVAQWLETGSREGRTFELHDGHPDGHGWSEVIDTVARLCGRRVLRVQVPAPALRLLAALNLMAVRLGGYAPMLTPGKVRELRHPNWVCDNRELRRATGWTPLVSLEEGVRRTLDSIPRTVAPLRERL
ncbi:MAG: NAD-dependent epimerase/dehydratase family protein [Candidatus Methylomirabilales bacterium]